MNELRFTLRSKTTEAHKRLDEALCVYDLKTRIGLTQYLKVHLLACLHLNELVTSDDLRCEMYEKIIALRSDLKVLNAAPSLSDILLPKTYQHPLGLTYVIAGSSLGGKLLAKQWAKSRDPVVRNAGKFINNAKATDSWKRFLTYTELNSFNPEEVEKIISAANYCFSVYEAAHQAISKEF